MGRDADEQTRRQSNANDFPCLFSSLFLCVPQSPPVSWGGLTKNWNNPDIVLLVIKSKEKNSQSLLTTDVQTVCGESPRHGWSRQKFALDVILRLSAGLRRTCGPDQSAQVSVRRRSSPSLRALLFPDCRVSERRSPSLFSPAVFLGVAMEGAYLHQLLSLSFSSPFLSILAL